MARKKDQKTDKIPPMPHAIAASLWCYRFPDPMRNWFLGRNETAEEGTARLKKLRERYKTSEAYWGDGYG